MEHSVRAQEQLGPRIPPWILGKGGCGFQRITDLLVLEEGAQGCLQVGLGSPE